jgi:hypothetical protein
MGAGWHGRLQRPPAPNPHLNPHPHPQGIITMLKKMRSRELDVPAHLGISVPCLQLLHRLMDPDPSARITVPEIMAVRLTRV